MFLGGQHALLPIEPVQRSKWPSHIPYPLHPVGQNPRWVRALMTLTALSTFCFQAVWSFSVSSRPLFPCGQTLPGLR